MVTNLRLLLLALLFAGTTGSALAQQPASIPSQKTREEALRRVATNRTRAFQFVAARLLSNTDVEFSRRQLDTLLDAPSGDMFWSFPAVGFYYYCRHLLDSSTRLHFRAALRRYAPYRGDTENHFLMHYTFLYLFAQEWPDMTAREWFNGRSSPENLREARDFLLHWIDDVSRHGMTEWDASRYQYFYITPLLTLADFAADDVVRTRSRMMLELLLADMATDYLDGNYVGAHSRDGDGVVLEPRLADANAYAGFYFEDTIRVAGPDLAYAAMSSWSAPPIIRCMAVDRSVPYVNREMKRSRGRMRNADSVYAVVDRYTFMTADYAIGSIQGDIQQPIQQHSWDVTFATERSRNTLFGLHPDATADELATFFPEEPELMEAGILSTKASYGSPEKWIGGSTHERIGQYRNVLVARYELPETVRWRHVDVFIPGTADTIVRLPNDWTIVRMGRTLAGLRTFSSDRKEWIDQKEGVRLRLHGASVIYLVEVVSVDTISLNDYVARRSSEREGDEMSRTSWGFQGVEGSVTVVVDNSGGVVVRGNEPVQQRKRRRLFDGPHLQSTEGSGVVELRCSGATRRLDFNRGETTE